MTLLLDEHPNDVAEQLTGRNYVSFSGINAYRSCPLKWYFRYSLGLPEKTVSSSLVFGSAIHRAVEHHYRELLTGNSAPGIDALLYEYQAEWQSRDLEAVRFCKGEDADTLGKLAERVLAAFQQSASANPTGRIVGVEEELRGPIADGCPDLLGRVDLLVDEGHELVLTDLKTAKSRWSRQQVDESSEQLLLYSGLAQELMPTKSLRLEFLVVTKAKTPVVETHRVRFDFTTIERTKRMVAQIWAAMQTGYIYPSPSPMNCSTCAFREPCQQWST